MKKIIILSVMAALSFSPCESQTEDQSVNSQQIKSFYVTAPGGLSLREYNNLNSTKLAIMPYGTKIDVVALELNNTMNIKGVKGGMHQVLYNNKIGFAFSGYLSELFPPENGSSAKVYIEDLKFSHPNASFLSCTGGTASQPTLTETILIPTKQWNEAFLIAQKLYNIPSEFGMPNPRGRNAQTIQSKYASDSVMNSLRVMRHQDSLVEIVYFYANATFGKCIIIKEHGTMMQIEFYEVIK